MKIVIVDKPHVRLELKKRQLYVDAQGIPLRLIELLVLQEDVILSSKLILKLSKEGIGIMHVGKNNMDIALSLPQFSKNSELKTAQYKALDNSLGLAKYFIEEKISRHLAHLKSIGTEVQEDIWKEKIGKAESVEVLLGIEGGFSKLYFKHYFKLFSPELHKGKRSKRPALDPVNAMLSYVYTMVYNLLTTKIYMAGFEPSISYLHTPFRSHYALSSDFMELFRAKVNERILEWFNDGVLRAEDFSMKNGVWLKYESRKAIWKEIKVLLHFISHEADKEISLIRTAIS
jgi:CRISPR-associated protein Cas1